MPFLGSACPTRFGPARSEPDKLMTLTFELAKFAVHEDDEAALRDERPDMIRALRASVSGRARGLAYQAGRRDVAGRGLHLTVQHVTTEAAHRVLSVGRIPSRGTLRGHTGNTVSNQTLGLIGDPRCLTRKPKPDETSHELVRILPAVPRVEARGVAPKRTSRVAFPVAYSHVRNVEPSLPRVTFPRAGARGHGSSSPSITSR